jgi:hypothetical protein
MPRPCSICQHPQRVEIEASVLSGVSIRSAAKAAGASPFALQRHLQHVASIVAKAVKDEGRQVDASRKLPARIEELIADVRAITKAAKKKHDWNAALAGIRANLSCLEMLGKISGELKPGGLGEFVPGNATAGAAASVTVNLPAAPAKRPEEFLQLIRQFYGLPPKPTKPEPIM